MSTTAPEIDYLSQDVGRSHIDALRSVKRYVALALGDDWEIRLSREEGAFARPFARVWQVAGTTYPLTGGRWLADMTQPFVVAAYPPPGRDPDQAMLFAQRTENALYRAFRVGVADGRPLRVPLYNYFRVSDWEAGTWYPHAFMRVNDISTQPFPDPDDNKLWTVVCDVRLTWRRLGETRPEAPKFTGVRLRRHWREPPCQGTQGSTSSGTQIPDVTQPPPDPPTPSTDPPLPDPPPPPDPPPAAAPAPNLPGQPVQPTPSKGSATSNQIRL